MTDHLNSDDGLSAFFDAARREAPRLSPGALDRMTDQALNLQAAQQASVQAGVGGPVAADRPGWFARALIAIGGWPAMATLATAGVAGLWIGAVPPAAVTTLATAIGVTSSSAEDDLYLVDPLPGYTLTLDLSEAQ